MIQRKSIGTAIATTRLENLCARAEHCESELAEKLRRWGIGASESAEIISGLRKHHFVDNARFARAFVRDKYRFARWGRMKIRMALAAKRISKEIVDEALEEIDEDIYTENLRHIIAAKARSLGEETSSYEGRTKIYRFAISRGYESSLISKILKSGQ